MSDIDSLGCEVAVWLHSLSQGRSEFHASQYPTRRLRGAVEEEQLGSVTVVFVPQKSVVVPPIDTVSEYMCINQHLQYSRI